MSTVEFDRIADMYDDTRRALDEETLNGMKRMLAKYGCHSILEIGVGTGRISVPLSANGFEMTGMDISRRMMERARAKDIKNLILADGTRPPFRARSFDGTLMAHVFHLLENPMLVVREAAGVSRVGVFALVRKRSEDGQWFGFYGGRVVSVDQGAGDEEETRAAKRFFDERRDRFRKISEKYGWNWDPEQRFRRWRKEQEILETNPPDDLQVVSDVLVTEDLEERISRFEKGAYSSMSSMPEEMRKELVKEMRANASSFPQLALRPRHEVYQVALWRSESLLKSVPQKV